MSNKRTKITITVHYQWSLRGIGDCNRPVCPTCHLRVIIDCGQVKFSLGANLFFSAFYSLWFTFAFQQSNRLQWRHCQPAALIDCLCCSLSFCHCCTPENGKYLPVVVSEIRVVAVSDRFELLSPLPLLQPSSSSSSSPQTLCAEHFKMRVPSLTAAV